jgi:hypothetical protein
MVTTSLTLRGSVSIIVTCSVTTSDYKLSLVTLCHNSTFSFSLK